MTFFTPTKQHFRNTLLFAAVFGIVVLVVFSPIVAPIAEANHVFRCTTGGTYGTPTSGCFANKTACKESCNGSGDTCNVVPDTDSFHSSAQCKNPSTGSVLTKAVKTAGEAAVKYVAGKIAKGIVEILKLINNGLVILVGWIAQILDAAIAISLAGLSGINAIAIGWTITRDIANIFFIFILLIIAIATILRLETYGAKQLLPKLIIIALLINFSLVIAMAIVDASNILALAFIGEISPVSDKIALVLSINKISDTRSELVPEHKEIEWTAVTSQGWENVLKGPLNQKFTVDEEVMNAAPVEPNEEDATVIEFFWQATILVLLLTLIFVFVALSVMLLVRSVALIIIFVLAPLGFLAAILPATRGYANQWWHKLFQWSFFFPASAFMIYLALAYGAQMSKVLPHGNHVINTAILFNYFATVALLMGSLVVAKQMGIVGAAAAIGIGLGLARRARGYAGKAGLATVGGAISGAASVTGLRAAGRKIGDYAGTALEGHAGRMPLVRGALSRISAGREKAIDAEMKRMSHLSPRALANMQTGITGMSYEAGVRTFTKLKPEEKTMFAATMGAERFNQFSNVVGQRLGPLARKEAAKAAASAFNDFQAIRILHPQEYGEMAAAPAMGTPQYDKYQRHVMDFFAGLTTKEIGMLNTNVLRTSDTFREYVFRTSKDLKEVLTKREHIQAFSENLRNFATKLPATGGLMQPITDQVANEIAKRGNKDLAGEFTKASKTQIGINIMLNAEQIPVRTKRGVVTTVTAEGE